MLFGPERFFQAVKMGRVTPRPFGIYVLVSALAGVGSGAALIHEGRRAEAGAGLGLARLECE